MEVQDHLHFRSEKIESDWQVVGIRSFPDLVLTETEQNSWCFRKHFELNISQRKVTRSYFENGRFFMLENEQIEEGSDFERTKVYMISSNGVPFDMRSDGDER